MKTLNNCTECTKEGKELTDIYTTVGKTYFKLYQYKDEPERILCYRHWYQKNQPYYELHGDYNTIFKIKK